MLNFACWNIRGINARIKQKEVMDVINRRNLSLCALVETHVKKENVGTTFGSVFGSWKWVSNTSLSDGGTRIMIAWNDHVCDVMIVDIHLQYIHCLVRVKGVSVPFFLLLLMVLIRKLFVESYGRVFGKLKC